MAGVHHTERSVRLPNGDDVAVQVGADLVGEIDSILPDDFLQGCS